MKIEKKSEPKAKMKVINGSAFAIETAPHLPKLHQACVVVAKRGGGKTTAVSNLLRMYKETGAMDRILIVSPTFLSNKKLLEHLDIDENDVFDDLDAFGIVEKIKDIVNAERDEFLRWKQLKANYEKVMKQMRAGGVYDDEFLMSYYDPKTNDFKVPEPKYPCYRQGRPPVISCIFDDCMNSRLYTGRALASLVISHRHQGQFPTGGAVGISLFFLIQSYKAQSNPTLKCIRSQATSALIFRTKSKDELYKDIAESFSGEIDPELFIELYNEATKDSPHDFLFVDLHHKKGIQPSGFRKNFDEYLIPPVN